MYQRRHARNKCAIAHDLFLRHKNMFRVPQPLGYWGG